MQIRKSVITAAGRGVRLYPAADTVEKAMLPFIDRDGLNKPVIQIIAEEALDSGIEEICVVCAPGDEEQYRRRFDLLRENLNAAHAGADWAAGQEKRLNHVAGRLTFVEQNEPLGYGHAVWCAREFVGDEPFLLLLSDHFYISHEAQRPCAQQLIDVAAARNCSVAAVHATPEQLVGQYGTVRGRRLPRETTIYQIERIVEKPSLSQAELELQVPGLRVGHYLCFFGMHVLTPTIFGLLGEAMEAARNDGGEVMLTPALEELSRREEYLALEMAGRRFDIGARYGLLRAQIALALAGQDASEALATIVETLAESRRDGEGS